VSGLTDAWWAKAKIVSADIDNFFNAVADVFISEWRSSSNCLGKDLKYFYEPEFLDEGRKICSSCAVRVECLDNSIHFNDGLLRGGLTEKERNSVELHRKRHLAAFRYDLEKADEG